MKIKFIKFEEEIQTGNKNLKQFLIEIVLDVSLFWIILIQYKLLYLLKIEI